MLLFSATWDEKVQIVAMSILCRDYKFVKVGEMNQPVSTITQHFIEVYSKKIFFYFRFFKVEKSQKTEKLLKILQEGAEERFLPSGSNRISSLKALAN
jgi:superfamily II DNA/RNA helicase